MAYKGTLIKGIGRVVTVLLCLIWFPLPAAAAEQTAIVVYLHPVATEVEILVDDLTIHRTETVFGAWCYQFNLTSFLDTIPRTITIRTRPLVKDSSYCEIEVRKITGGAEPTILAEKTTRAADGVLNAYQTAVTLEVALPEGSVRPLWADSGGIDRTSVARDTSVAIMKEVCAAVQKGDVDSLMTLIDPALTNQAMMEGVSPDLFKQAMRRKLMQYLIPGIPISKSMEIFSEETFVDRMAPPDFKNMRYSYMRDLARKDRKGNLFSPEEPVRYRTRENRGFVVRIFLSYTDDMRKRQVVSRFLFEQTK